MILKANSKVLVLRFNNYKKWNFIEEHTRILNSTKYVWILKAGKYIKEHQIEDVLRNGGNLILKEPKKDGGKYYYLHICDFYNGNVEDEFNFPQYYYEMLDDYEYYTMEELSGTWIKVDYLKQLENGLDRLRLISNDKGLDETISSTRSALLYAYSNTDIEI